MAASSSYKRPYVVARSNEWWEQPEEQFQREFRMSKQTFQMICVQLETNILSRKRRRRINVTVEQQVAVTIWRLATGATYHELSQKFGMAVNSCKSARQDTITAIMEVMLPNWICWPDRCLMNINKERFLRVSGIPNVGGVMYTTHVPMFPPEVGANMYYNESHTERAWEATGKSRVFKFTTTIQGVVDHRGLFTELCVGYPGRNPDENILMESGIYKWNLRDVWIVGTSRHPLLDWVLVPYTPGNLTPQQQNFNQKLGILQDVAKNAFQKLKRRWAVLQKESRLEVEDLNEEMKACCVLHNICEVRHEPMFPEWNYELFDDETTPQNMEPSAAAIRARDELANSLPLAPQLVDRLD